MGRAAAAAEVMVPKTGQPCFVATSENRPEKWPSELSRRQLLSAAPTGGHVARDLLLATLHGSPDLSSPIQSALWRVRASSHRAPQYEGRGSSFGAWVHQSDIPTRWRRLEASCSSLAPAVPSRGLHAISTRSHLALLDALLLARLG